MSAGFRAHLHRHRLTVERRERVSRSVLAPALGRQTDTNPRPRSLCYGCHVGDSSIRYVCTCR